jgi:hypothetical protein
MNKGLKIEPQNVFTEPLDIQPEKVKDPNQSMPITAKVKMSQGGTKLKG